MRVSPSSSPWGSLHPPHRGLSSILPMALFPLSSPWVLLHGLLRIISTLLPTGFSPPPFGEALDPPPHAQDLPQGLGLSPPARRLWGAGSAGTRLPAQHQGPDGDEAVGRDIPHPGHRRGHKVRDAGDRWGGGDSRWGPGVAPRPPNFPILRVNAGFFGPLIRSVEAGLPPGAGGGWWGHQTLLFLDRLLEGWGPQQGGRSWWLHLLCGRDGGLGWRGEAGGPVPPPHSPLTFLQRDGVGQGALVRGAELCREAGDALPRTVPPGAKTLPRHPPPPNAPPEASAPRLPTLPVLTRSGTVAVPAGPALPSGVAGAAGSSQPAQAGQGMGCWEGFGG